MPPCCPEPPDVCVSGFIRLWIKVVSVYVIFLNAFFTYVLYPHSSWTTTKKCTMILPSSRPLCIWVVPHEFQPTTNVCDQLYDCLRLSLFAFYFFFFYVLCVIFLVLVLFVVAFPRALHCCGVIHHIISVHTHTQFQTTMPIQHTHTHLQHTTRTHTYNIALPHTNTDTTPTNYS